tara:strand:+ start:38 stop:250 length:213 start_codon:yes stop_codon:yes gene_type:complete
MSVVFDRVIHVYAMENDRAALFVPKVAPLSWPKCSPGGVGVHNSREFGDQAIIIEADKSWITLAIIVADY